MLCYGETFRMNALMDSIVLVVQNWGTEILLAVNVLLLVGCAVILYRRLPPAAFSVIKRHLQTLEDRQAHFPTPLPGKGRGAPGAWIYGCS